MAGHHDEIRLAFAHDVDDRLRRRSMPYHCIGRDTQRVQVLHNRAQLELHRHRRVLVQAEQRMYQNKSTTPQLRDLLRKRQCARR
jgi:hypothetical protein